MKVTVLLLFFFIISCGHNKKEIRVVHYNIKELTTEKLQKGNPQLEAVNEILAEEKMDILSVNEVQFDLPGVPQKKNLSHGENLKRLAIYLGLEKQLIHQSFAPANTGKRAKRKANGEYYQNPGDPEARKNSDPDSFGLFPGQYSTGLLSRFAIKKEVIISDLKWQAAFPDRNLKGFRGGDEKALNPDIALFDKNFSHLILDAHGKELHVILLHAVPAYHFGNKASPNYARNADQLRFLEWYLTGSTDKDLNHLGIRPLPSDARFIAMGDWNVEYQHKENEGAKVLRRLMQKIKFHVKKPTFTNEGWGYGKTPFRLTLDYIAYGGRLKLSHGETIYPSFDMEYLGCKKTGEFEQKRIGADQKQVFWQDRKKGTCSSVVHRDWEKFKTASDHYPLKAKFVILP